MVDVSAKPETWRTAVAEGMVVMSESTLQAILQGDAPKGNVFAVARVAGIMAAKRTHELIPLCHPLPIAGIEVEIEPDASLPGLRITTTAKVSGRTGVEMEALTAASIAALTVYDMLKAIDKGIEIGPIRLLEKRGGKSGYWKQKERVDATH
jgi:cyclic pyranopterin monophosphate synthase